MRRLLRWTLRIVIGLVVLLLLTGVIGYFATSGDHRVPATVLDDPKLPSAVIAGVKLHLETRGDPSKPTVIVLHGGPGGDYRYLLPMAPLADDYYVVFYDQRGSGLSERVDPSKLTLDGLYAELDAIVDRYGKGKPVRLIGHSWGGMLASGYLGRHPHKVSHAVLAEPGMLTSATAQILMERTNHMRPPMSLEVLTTVTRAWLRSLHVNGPDEQARDDFFMYEVMTTPVKGHPVAGYYCNEDFSTAHLPSWRFGSRVGPTLFAQATTESGRLRVDFVAGADQYRGKVLFIAGSCDKLLGENTQRMHIKHFPGARLEVIAHAGHTMLGEKPKQSLALIRSFFAEASPASGPTSQAAETRTPDPSRR